MVSFYALLFDKHTRMRTRHTCLRPFWVLGLGNSGLESWNRVCWRIFHAPQRCALSALRGTSKPLLSTYALGTWEMGFARDLWELNSALPPTIFLSNAPANLRPSFIGAVKSLGASSYILQKNFSFSTALFHAVSFEGTLDHLNDAADTTPTSHLEIPLSFPSLPTMPPSPAPSSPLSSVPSSPEILGSMLPEPPFPSTLQSHSLLPASSAPS